MFRGTPLTITRHFLERFCMRAMHLVSHYNETPFFLKPFSFINDLSMGGGGA